MRWGLPAAGLLAVVASVAAEPATRPEAEFVGRIPNGLHTIVVPAPGVGRLCLALVLRAGKRAQLDR